MSNQDASKLAKHTLIYGIGTALSAAAGFLLIPIYTKNLPTSEYGLLELVNRTADIFMLIMLLGIKQSYIRFYLDNEDEEWRKRVTSTTLIFLIFSSLSLIVLIGPLHNIISRIVFVQKNRSILIFLMLIWIPFEVFISIGLAYLQINVKSTYYVFVNAIKLTLIIGINIYFIYFLKKGVTAIVLTNSIVAFIIAAPFIVFLFRWAGIKFDRSIFISLIKFGLPFVPSSVLMFVAGNAGRYFLIHFTSLATVGIYALAFKIGSFGSSLMVSPFLRVWSPFLLNTYKNSDGHLLISKVYKLFTIIILTVGVAISTSAPIILPFISGEEYTRAYKIIPFTCLYAALMGMAQLSDAGILIGKKTFLKLPIFGSTALVSIILNLILIPFFDIIGAAVALCGTAGYLLVVNHRISQKYYQFPVHPEQLIFIFILFGIVNYSGLYFYKVFNESFISSLTPLFMIAFIVPLFFVRILSIKDIVMFKKSIFKSKSVK